MTAKPEYTTAEVESGELVCRRDLDAFDDAEAPRYRQLFQTLLASIQEVRELPDGYSFELPGDPQSIRDTAEFIALERRCCRFFRFILEITPAEGPVWLQITGASGVKEFLEAELAALSDSNEWG